MYILNGTILDLKGVIYKMMVKLFEFQLLSIMIMIKICVEKIYLKLL